MGLNLGARGRAGPVRGRAATTPGTGSPPSPGALARPWYAGLGRLPRPLALLLAVLWAAAIWRLSSGPIDVGAHLPLGRLLNNLAHGPVYALLAGALCFALPRRLTPFPWPVLTPLRVLAVLCFTLAYGCLDEWHQMGSPGRHGSWADLFTDFAGGLLACAAVSGLGAPQRRRSVMSLAAALLLVVVTALLATYGPQLSIATVPGAN